MNGYVTENGIVMHMVKNQLQHGHKANKDDMTDIKVQRSKTNVQDFSLWIGVGDSLAFL